MPVPNLIIPRSLFSQIESEGEAGYPNEICGMIFGRETKDAAGNVRRATEKLVVGKNVFEADEQYHRFSIDPREQMKAERAADLARGLSVPVSLVMFAARIAASRLLWMMENAPA